MTSTLTRPTSTGAAPIGLYVRDDEVYLVRPAKRNPRNRYALNIGNLRCGSYVTENYSPGVVFNLHGDERMTLDQVKRYGDLSGKCAWCGHALTTDRSRMRGMGPTCYRHLTNNLKD